MANTTIKGEAIRDGSVKAVDLNLATAVTLSALSATTYFVVHDTNEVSATKTKLVATATMNSYFQPFITAGTTAQYYRGDKTWQTLPTSLPASDVSAWAKASTKPSYTFSEIGSKPTTIAGYGITDVATSHTHSYLPLAGGTLTGNLTVVGSLNASGENCIRLTRATFNTFLLGIDNIGFYIYDETAVAYAMSISAIGNATFRGTATASDFITGSDRRLKTNIKSLGSHTMDIAYKSFERKDALGKTRYGVIAQELQLACPELVSTDSNGFLSVSYTDLHSLEISSLKIRVKELEQQLIRLQQ